MKVSQLIAQHLLDVYTGGNWTEVSVAATISDVTYSDAITITAAFPNSIASIVNHLHFWNQVMTQRLQRIKPEIPEANGFDLPPIQSEQEWKTLIKEMLASASLLALAISTLSENRLEQLILPGYSTVYKSVQGSVEHIHYHLGQIVILKKLLRS
jgi:hypothetical protein